MDNNPKVGAATGCPCNCPLIKLYESLMQEKREKEENSFTDEWCDWYDLARYMKISKRTVQTLRKNGTLPSSRIGHKIYFKLSDIKRILADNYICNTHNIKRI